MRWVRESARTMTLETDERRLAFVGTFGNSRDVKVFCGGEGPWCGGCQDYHYKLGLTLEQAAEHIGRVLGVELPPLPCSPVE